MKIVELPPALAVGAEYGVTVLNSAPPVGKQFVDYLLSADGQRTLRKYGFR